jgi:hypothetical protein
MSPHGRVAVTLGIALHPLLAYAFWLAPEPNRMRRSTQGGCQQNEIRYDFIGDPN